MDRATMVDSLAMAERHVHDGENHLRRQRALVLWLREGGHETATADALLKLFEDTQRLHLADRDRLRRELAEPH